MTGPTVTILLPRELDGAAKQIVLEFVAEVSESMEGKDFWIEGRPFRHAFGPDYPEELGEYVELSNLLGWQPKDIIGLVAMCNDHQDHQLLGKITLGVAQRLNGVIAFGSTIARYTSDSKFLKKNEILEYKHETILNIPSFEAWLSHPDFRMVK